MGGDSISGIGQTKQSGFRTLDNTFSGLNNFKKAAKNFAATELVDRLRTGNVSGEYKGPTGTASGIS